LWRTAAGDTELVHFTRHFDEGMGPNQFDAVKYDDDAQGIAAAAQPGDQLVLRFTATGSGPQGTRLFIPNADGANANGRIPSITPPR
jgi:hypothetical protein